MCHKDESVSVCVSVGVCVFVPLQYDDISQISFEQFCNFNQLYLYVMARECARTPHVAPPTHHPPPTMPLVGLVVDAAVAVAVALS